MDSYVVALLYIGEAFTPCAWMLQVVHAHNVYDHPVEDLYLAISLGWNVMDLVSLVSSIDQRID